MLPIEDCAIHRYVPRLFRLSVSYRSPAGHGRLMGSTRLEQISDFARKGYRLRVKCRECGHRELLDPVPIAMQCHARGWRRDLDSIGARMRCKTCGHRGAECGPG